MDLKELQEKRIHLSRTLSWQEELFASQSYRFRITPYYASLIDSSDPHCPIALQAIPFSEEKDPELPVWLKNLSLEIYGRENLFLDDAIGDLTNLAAPRLTHRYGNRALLHTSASCAVYCRFCFRKTHLNDSESELYEGEFKEAFQYLRNHPEISEIILTGGDPLSIPDSELERVFSAISEISSIKVLRIHSRMLVTLPARFTEKILTLFQKPWPFEITLVSHFNHPKELTELVREKTKLLKKSGVTLLNQSVLLKKVNNDVSTLEALFQKLYEMGIISYYLHHPDLTKGTFHFRVSIQEGLALYKALKGVISGPALPRYVLDIPQGHGKMDLETLEIRKISTTEDCENKMTASVYELSSPKTRKGIQKVKYLDLSSV